MNDKNNNKSLSDAENYEELLKKFLPRDERESEMVQPGRSNEQKAAAQTERRQGIYFSQSKNRDMPVQTASTTPRVQPAQQQTAGDMHILIQPKKNSVSAQQGSTRQPNIQQPNLVQTDTRPAQPSSRPAQSTVAFPAQSAQAANAPRGQRAAAPMANRVPVIEKTAAKSASANEKRRTAPTMKVKSSGGRSASAVNKRSEVKKSGKRNSQVLKYTTMVRVVICLAFVTLIIASAALIKIPLMGCINDIIAIDGTDDEISVTVTEGMSTRQIINMLGDKGLINNPVFCNIISDFLGYDGKTEYPAGTYTLTSEMGVEGMLAEIMAAGKDTQTVTLTFPEGYTVEQIIARLASNGVASSGSLYAAITDYEFTGMFEYLNGIRDSHTRFSALEGYLYPDTYDFYVGENPNSVIRKFLANFEEKWTEVYAARAQELGYSLDEILTVASIVEKEAFDAKQMPIVASVLYNRLGAAALYPHLECDSTADYVEKLLDDAKINNAEFYSLLMLYDTYQVTGLPEGPVSNPGGDAINAALYPDSTLYYYFMHDKQGNIYLASTVEEHAANAVAAGIG